MASQMENRRGCFGRRDYVSQPMASPMCHREEEEKEEEKEEETAAATAAARADQSSGSITRRKTVDR